MKSELGHYQGRGSEEGRGRERHEKRTEMCWYVYVPTPQEECDHYVLPLCPNKKWKLSKNRSSGFCSHLTVCWGYRMDQTIQMSLRPMSEAACPTGCLVRPFSGSADPGDSPFIHLLGWLWPLLGSCCENTVYIATPGSECFFFLPCLSLFSLQAGSFYISALIESFICWPFLFEVLICTKIFIMCRQALERHFSFFKMPLLTFWRLLRTGTAVGFQVQGCFIHGCFGIIQQSHRH